MDWSTVVFSAAVSAIVGTIVSLVAVSQVAVRRARAENRYEATQRIKTLVAPVIADVVKYRAGMAPAVRREENLYHSADFVTASQILSTAAPLGWVRKQLVRRRCRLIFGEFTTKLAEVSPSSGDSLGDVMAPLISATYGGGDFSGSIGKQLDGLAYEALTQDHESSTADKLLRHLRRLAECR